jgi:hypothetical protein
LLTLADVGMVTLPSKVIDARKRMGHSVGMQWYLRRQPLRMRVAGVEGDLVEKSRSAIVREGTGCGI